MYKGRLGLSLGFLAPLVVAAAVLAVVAVYTPGIQKQVSAQSLESVAAEVETVYRSELALSGTVTFAKIHDAAMVAVAATPLRFDVDFWCVHDDPRLIDHDVLEITDPITGEAVSLFLAPMWDVPGELVSEPYISARVSMGRNLVAMAAQ